MICGPAGPASVSLEEVGDFSMTRLRGMSSLLQMLGPITTELNRVVAYMSTQTGTGCWRISRCWLPSREFWHLGTVPPFQWWGGKYRPLPECYEINSRSMAPPGE
jgi:hypothetical protein